MSAEDDFRVLPMSAEDDLGLDPYQFQCTQAEYTNPMTRWLAGGRDLQRCGKELNGTIHSILQ